MTLADRLAARIAAEGPIPLADYMAACNAHYYASRDPLGAAGDFITAPEISQMFGELIGLCLADLWQRAGAPADTAWVELGPGRGTLTSDALRAAAKAGFAPAVHLVETSPALRTAQARLLPDATWHDAIGTLPADRPLLIVANEFFDALPIRQSVRDGGAWRERAVDHANGTFLLAVRPLSNCAPAKAGALEKAHELAKAPAFAGAQDGWEDGAIFEASPAALAIMQALAARLAAQGGALLIIDYGHTQTAPGDTLQAVHRHALASPWENPGDHDLTAHVDFAALAAAASLPGARTHGPVDQGQFLTALGIAQRAAALARAAPERTEELAAQHRRLVDPAEMGRLFKVLAVTSTGWPMPAGM